MEFEDQITEFPLTELRGINEQSNSPGKFIRSNMRDTVVINLNWVYADEIKEKLKRQLSEYKNQINVDDVIILNLDGADECYDALKNLNEAVINN